MFKAFVFADLHMGNHLPHSVPDSQGITDRLVDSCCALKWVLAKACELKVPVYCLGDFFDERLVDSVTLKHLGSILSQSNGLHVIPGNHDASDQTNKHFSPEGIQTLGGKINVLKDTVVPELNLAAIQFCGLKQLRNWINENAADDLLMLGHIEVVGYGHGGTWQCPVGLLESELEGFGAVLSGHFHKYQEFTAVQGGYIGALRQLNFSDENKLQGGWLVEWDGNELKMEFHEYKVAPQFINLEGEAEEAVEEIKKITKGNYVRVIINGTEDQIKKFPKKEIEEIAYGNGVRRVVFKDNKIYHHTKKRMDAGVDASFVELVKKYVDSDYVNIGNLNAGKLMEIGKSVIEEAELKMKKV